MIGKHDCHDRRTGPHHVDNVWDVYQPDSITRQNRGKVMHSIGKSFLLKNWERFVTHGKTKQNCSAPYHTTLAVDK